MNLYERLGGAEGVRALVDAFYDHMDRDPAVATVRAMHPADLRVAREKLYEFLSGWLGGPPLYIEKYGHPRLRARHLPFAIDVSARDQWMTCMRAALALHVADVPLRLQLEDSFLKVADHMRNK